MNINIISKLYNLPRELLLVFLKRRGLTIGKNFYCGLGVVLDSSFCWLITIGDNVTLADRVYILAHDASSKHLLNYTRIGRVAIGNRVFIGTASVILPGVTIGDDVVIGAGSVVTGDIPSRSVAIGNPARIVETIDAFIARKQREMQSYPCFGEEYTLGRKITTDKQVEMNDMMKGKYGYVV